MNSVEVFILVKATNLPEKKKQRNFPLLSKYCSVAFAHMEITTWKKRIHLAFLFVVLRKCWIFLPCWNSRFPKKYFIWLSRLIQPWQWKLESWNVNIYYCFLFSFNGNDNGFFSWGKIVMFQRRGISRGWKLKKNETWIFSNRRTQKQICK